MKRACLIFINQIYRPENVLYKIKRRDNKYINNHSFGSDLFKELSLWKVQLNNHEKFQFLLTQLLDSYAPLEGKLDVTKVSQMLDIPTSYNRVTIFTSFFVHTMWSFRNLSIRKLTGFRKGCSVLNSLQPIFEKFRESKDHCGKYGALLTDLSKAFNCLQHEHLIAKLWL